METQSHRSAVGGALSWDHCRWRAVATVWRVLARFFFFRFFGLKETCLVILLIQPPLLIKIHNNIKIVRCFEGPSLKLASIQTIPDSNLTFLHACINLCICLHACMFGVEFSWRPQCNYYGQSTSMSDVEVTVYPHVLWGLFLCFLERGGHRDIQCMHVWS